MINFLRILVMTACVILLMTLALIIVYFVFIDPSVKLKNASQYSVIFSIKEGLGSKQIAVAPQKSHSFRPNGDYTFKIFAWSEDNQQICGEGDCTCEELEAGMCDELHSVFSRFGMEIVLTVDQFGAFSLKKLGLSERVFGK